MTKLCKTARAARVPARSDMRNRGEIVPRMARDMVDLAKEVDGVEAWHLEAIGWSRLQVRLYAPAATDRALADAAGLAA